MRVFLLVTGGVIVPVIFVCQVQELSAKCFVAIRTDVLISRNVPQHFP